MKILQVTWKGNRRFFKSGGAQTGDAQIGDAQTRDVQTRVPKLGVPKPGGSPVLDSPAQDCWILRSGGNKSEKSCV